jgi:hypothetical protein
VFYQPWGPVSMGPFRRDGASMPEARKLAATSLQHHGAVDLFSAN